MIWIILILGLILRLISLNQSLWLDEAINTLAVKNYSLFDLITQYARADFHPPGWFIILWFWGKLFGYSEIAVRIPSVIFGAITIYITYLIGKKLVSRKLGIIAALLISVNPLHIYYSQEARMYALATLAVSVSILLFLKAVKGEKPNLFFLILSNIFVLLSDYIAYFIFPAQLVFLWFYRKEFLKKWFIALLLAVTSGFWWLPTFLGQFDVGSVASANLPTWKLVAGAFDFKTLPLTFVKFIIGRISLADKTLYAAVLLPICSLFAYLIFKGVKYLNDSPKKILLAWIIIPPLIATIISFVIPVYNYFRVLYILPSFIILVSLGILSMKRFKYIFLSLVILIELFCALVYLLNPLYQREDWKGLVSFFRNKPALILFESSGTLPPFDYYAGGELKAKGALKDFPAKYESDVVDLIETEREIYLVDYLVQISDPNRLVAKRLTNLGYKQLDIKNFTGVGFVYHYVKE
mgnify:CR=1 FL=1